MKQKTKFFCTKCMRQSEGDKCTHEDCLKPVLKTGKPEDLFKRGDFVLTRLTDTTSEFHNKTGRVAGYQGANVMVDLGADIEFPRTRVLAFDVNEVHKIYFNTKELEDDLRWASPLYFCSVCRFSSANPDRCTNTLCELNQVEEGFNCADNPNCDNECCQKDEPFTPKQLVDPDELPLSPYTKNIMAGGCVQTFGDDLPLPAPPPPEPKGEPVQIKILAEKAHNGQLIVYDACSVDSDYCLERIEMDNLVDAHVLTLTLDADKLLAALPEPRQPIEVDLR